MPARKRFLLSFAIALAIFLFSPRFIFAASINLSGALSQLSNPEEEYAVNVALSINVPNGTTYYLRGVFYKQNTNNYCGYTWNENAWFSGPYSSNEGWKNFLEVTIQDASWFGQLKAKVDSEDTNCQESGTYNFKVQRFTQNGSGSFDSQNEQVLEISIPTFTPTPIPSPIPTSTPTPALTPTPYPSGIILSEFMPDPDDGSEWVEIKNISSSDVVLVDWKIDDIADGGGSPKKFSTSINSGGYYKIDLDSNSFLNNPGDEVRLLYPDGSLVDKTSYSYSDKDVSWIKTDATWCESENATPGSANSSCRSQPSSESNPTPTPTPTPTKKPTPTPTLKPSPTPSLDAEDSTDSGEILGEKNASSSFYPWESSKEEENALGEKDKKLWLPKLLLILGLAILFSVSLYLWYNIQRKSHEL